ncbi:MAG: UTRA domain-containing protein [Beijerinckiaceae bacterium]
MIQLRHLCHKSWLSLRAWLKRRFKADSQSDVSQLPEPVGSKRYQSPEEPHVLTYALSGRTRFSRNLIEQGFDPNHQRLVTRTVPAGGVVGARLAIPESQSVSHSRSIGKANGVSINLSDTYVPINRFPNWADVKARHATHTEAFAHFGVRDYRRLCTWIEARLPTSEEAELLNIAQTTPVIVVTSVDGDLEKLPILYRQALWCADRVKFAIEEQ